MPNKYIFENGVMKLNPQYQASQPSTIAHPDKALAVVSDMKDVFTANAVREQAKAPPLHMAESTQAAMQIIQDETFAGGFSLSDGRTVDSTRVLEDLTGLFAQYEIPLGLLNKLLFLMEYNTRMIIDDSGSMTLPSDVKRTQASIHMKDRKLPGYATGHYWFGKEDCLSRWEEAEDRLHILIDILAYIPTPPITIVSMNHKSGQEEPNFSITLDHSNKTPQEFAEEAHAKIAGVFRHKPCQRTPTCRALSEAFRQATGKTMHYLFTDGVPTGQGESEELAMRIVKDRHNAKSNPLTFISCTNEDDEAEWMKQIEESAPYTGEVDDFNDEKAEVARDQGPGFPYSRGFWLMSMLVGAINPDDIDALDDSMPFSRMTMSNLLGHQLSQAEYQQYFSNHPKAATYQQYLPALMSVQAPGKKIIEQRLAPVPTNEPVFVPPVVNNTPPVALQAQGLQQHGMYAQQSQLTNVGAMPPPPLGMSNGSSNNTAVEGTPNSGFRV